ncbi:hypothetical protein LIER_12125 [Lithospermum erythrorhizon]|uniref:Uncharacterized protein n=1 Tax=Lithospermum erythrorhizon TaxID=34254 RepID=A0AAV3PUV9_LITER
MHNPSVADMATTNRILRYLANTPSLGICIQPSSFLTLKVVDCEDQIAGKNRKIGRRSGLAMSRPRSRPRGLFGGGGFREACREMPGPDQTKLLAKTGRSGGGRDLLNPILHSRSKHSALDYYFVREKVTLEDLIVKYVPTQLQLADTFSKPLSTTKFISTVSNLCLIQPAKIEGV